MRPTTAAAVFAALLPIGAAHAEWPDRSSWHRVLDALAQSLIGSRGDSDRVAPPENIDPKMAFVPPRNGTMRIIDPSATTGRRP